MKLNVNNEVYTVVCLNVTSESTLESIFSELVFWLILL